MRRADRLIKITHFLRQRRRAVTAKQIGEEFGICTRTVYRDIQHLMDAGVPISGEAGVGYVIDKQFYLPPITFDPDELEAIGLGISMAGQWTDENFASKAASAFEKIKAALPAELQTELQQVSTYAMPSSFAKPWDVNFTDLRECIRKRQKIHIAYSDEREQQTSRIVRPLALFFYMPVWLLCGWCDKRQDFRNFRIDRIQNVIICEDIFEDEADKNLSAYLAQNGSCVT